MIGFGKKKDLLFLFRRNQTFGLVAQDRINRLLGNIDHFRDLFCSYIHMLLPLMFYLPVNKVAPQPGLFKRCCKKNRFFLFTGKVCCQYCS
jgi:hypothetical protein